MRRPRQHLGANGVSLGGAPPARPDDEDVAHLIERGKRLRRFREARGLTQAQLAEKIGFKQGQISNWEAGLRGMTATTATVLARALHITTDQLLMDSDPQLPVFPDDPYPNRRRLRALPEFAEAPQRVQDYIVSLKRVGGDRPFLEWIAEFERLRSLDASGRWSTLFDGEELSPPPRQQRPRVR